MNREKIKTIALYTGLVLAGLIAGWLLFGRTSDDSKKHTVESVNEAATEFTCSMHPQVRQDEPGDCPICGMDLIPVSDHSDHQEDDPFLYTMQNSHSSWANVRTQKIAKTNAGIDIRLSGKVVVNEKEKRSITAHFPGRIEKLYADFTGKLIKKGEKLATIYSSEMAQAQEELLQASANKDTQLRLYNAARKRLSLFNLTDHQINQIEKNGEASSTMDVYATISGYLTERSVSEGDYVSVGQELFTIAGLSNVWIELDAYENQVGRIKAGQKANVEIPGKRGKTITGKIEFIDPLIDPSSRTAKVRLTVANPDLLLKPEMLAYATIKGAPQNQLIIPTTAILWTGKRSIVYVKNKQGENNITFEFREIETGDMTEAGYIVLSGLSEGEEIAVNGVFAIDASAQLRGHYSMMSPPEKIIIPENFKTNLKGIFDEYFKIKNALADDNTQSAQNYAKSFKKQLEKTGQHSLDGEHHIFWMQQYEAIESSTAKFLKADNKETMRMHFEPLSKTMIETARTFGAIGQTFYVAFCPMYDNDRGAYWLSEFKEIKNPYFGSMMLRCGEVRETIREGIGAESTQQPREVEGHVH